MISGVLLYISFGNLFQFFFFWIGDGGWGQSYPLFLDYWICFISYKLSYSQFCLKFRFHGNKGRSEVNLNDPVELAVPENHTIEPKITNLSCIQPSYDH